MQTIKVTPSFLIKLMSLARSKDSDVLIRSLDLKNSTFLTEGVLLKMADDSLPTVVEKIPMMVGKEVPLQEIPMSFFRNGDEVLGYITRFVNERPSAHISPPRLMEIVSRFYQKANGGQKVSYAELMNELLGNAQDFDEISLPSPTTEINEENMQQVQKDLGMPVGTQTGPSPTEEEFASLPLRR